MTGATPGGKARRANKPALSPLGYLYTFAISFLSVFGMLPRTLCASDYCSLACED